MKILTHNQLKSPVKGVAKGYPMQLEIEEIDIQETEGIEERQLEFMRSIIPTLDWEGILLASKKIDGFQDLLPEVFDAALLEDQNFLEAMYHLLIDINIVRGKLICPETEKEFLIENGIPNMM